MEITPHSKQEITSDILNEENVRSISETIEASLSKNTRKAYDSDMRYFFAYLEVNNIDAVFPIDPIIISKFIDEHFKGTMSREIETKLMVKGVKQKRGALSVSTLERRISSLSKYHTLRDLPDPTKTQAIKMQLVGMRKIAANAKTKAKDGITRDILEDILFYLGDRDKDIRDKAMILVAFASGGRRRSEVEALDIEDVVPSGDDYIIMLGATKTDQTNEEEKPKPVKGIAAEALAAWLEVLKKNNINSGPLFRSIRKTGTISKNRLGAKFLTKVIKELCDKAGYDSTKYSAHSLRSGFVTEAGNQNKNLFAVMDLTGHKDVNTAKRYYRRGNVLHNDSSDLLD